MNGLFITFEGNDGSGKTTLANMLCQYLKDNGYDVIFTREPGGCPIAEEIRKVILDKNNVGMSSVAETLLYAASRAQHVQDVIAPSLNSGKIVISDRYVDSSYAYQGFGRELGFKVVKEINDIATGGCMPDLTFLIDVDLETALGRRKASSFTDRLDDEEIEFHKRNYLGFCQLAKAFPDRIKCINGNQSLDIIHKHVCYIVDNLLKERGISSGYTSRTE